MTILNGELITHCSHVVVFDAEGDKNSVKVKQPEQAMGAELKRSHSRSELRAALHILSRSSPTSAAQKFPLPMPARSSKYSV